MSVEHFTKAQFEAALPRRKSDNEPLWRPLGLIKGEWTYVIPVDDSHIGIEIRSSVDAAGNSRETGQDSIRVWLVQRSDHSQVGWVQIKTPKPKRWTTRTVGWEQRLVELLRKEYARARKFGKYATPCLRCGKPKFIAKAKTRRQLFVKCWDCDYGFEWVPEI